MILRLAISVTYKVTTWLGADGPLFVHIGYLGNRQRPFLYDIGLLFISVSIYFILLTTTCIGYILHIFIVTKKNMLSF